MNKLQELLAQIKTTLQENNTNLLAEDNRFQNLSTQCESITNSLHSIEEVLEKLNKLNSGIEVSPEDLQNSLRELNLTELTGKSLKSKLVEILSLANESNKDLADKIKDAEQELEIILTNLQTQQNLITTYQARITQLESKITSNENKTKDLAIKASLISASITASLGGLLVILANYLKTRKNA